MIKKREVSSRVKYSLLILLVLVPACCATIPIEQRIDYIPMYGQPEIKRPEFAKEMDEDFIEEASSGFGGNRYKASHAWATVAGDYLKKGNHYYAMRRYNQAWLLDPKNYRVHWGFGQIMLERTKYDEAIRHFEKAKELINDSYQEPALLTDTGIASSFRANSFSNNQTNERNKYFNIANQHFKKAFLMDKTFLGVWRRWASSLFREGNYSESWEKVIKARSLGADPFPESFLNKLREKMPERKDNNMG
jgi:tetratricopeptide (TPR) repeat protein